MNETIREVLMRGPVDAASLLLGCVLYHQTSDGLAVGKIVETEAYSMEDPASHSFRGLTARTAPMFEAAGTIYVYFTYGMHECVNIVTGPAGHGEAVLIRALEPLQGIPLMQQRRGVEKLELLTSGPARLVQAMGISRSEDNGIVLSAGHLWIESGEPPERVVQTTRIGIKRAREKPWRFYVAESSFVSRK